MALGLYLALLPLWWVTLDGLALILATISDRLYQLLDPRVTSAAAGKTITFVITANQVGQMGAQANSVLQLDKWTYGWPMLVALVLTTKADSWRVKLTALGLGSLVMLGLTLASVLLWARMAALQLDEQMAQALTGSTGHWSGYLNTGLHGYAFAQPIVAVVIWLGLVLLGQFKAKAATPKASTIGRNEPCPCGSGRKYKRCCGQV